MKTISFKKILFILLLALIFNAVAQGPACAGDIDFADYLFSIGEYDRAITEYYRYKFKERNASSAETDYKIALCYQKLNKSEKAAEILNRLYAEKTNLSEEALFDLALMSYKDTRLSNSIEELREYISKFPHGKYKDDAEYMLAVGYINDGDFSQARRILRDIRQKDSHYADSAASILRELRKEDELKLKSKGTAGILSAVLPGAGQFYAGRKGDGVASLVMNAAVTGAAVAAFDNDEDVLGYFMSFWEVSFYFGNIYSAISAANKHNREKTEEFKHNILNDVRVDMVGSKRDQMLRMKIRF